MDLTCKDCQGTFEFTDGEKSFYIQKGYEAPKRCADCREKKKARFDEKERNGGQQ